MIEQIKGLANNQVFVGIVTAGALGSLAYMGRSSLGWIAQKVKRTFTSSVTLNSFDAPVLFAEFSSFLFSLPTFSKIKTVNILEKDRYGMGNRDDDEKSFAASPSAGLYWGVYKKRIVFTEITKEKNQNGGETVNLTFGAFSRTDKFLRGITNQIINKIQNKDLVKIEAGHSHFTRKKRSMDSIFLQDGQKEKIINGITNFFASEAKYHELGSPYCYKLLLHGQPGTGKSSLVFALASHFDLKIQIISTDLDDRQVRNLISEVKERTLVLVEDVDVSQFSIARDSGKEKIPLACLLNFMDGLLVPEGSIIVLTTNHLDKLDPALTRPGRIDMAVNLDFFSREFADSVSQKLLGAPLPESFKDEKISPAELLATISQLKQRQVTKV